MDEGQAVAGQQEQDMTVKEHRRSWCSADGSVSKLVLKEGAGVRGRGRLASTGELREALPKHIEKYPGQPRSLRTFCPIR